MVIVVEFFYPCVMMGENPYGAIEGNSLCTVHLSGFEFPAHHNAILSDQAGAKVRSPKCSMLFEWDDLNTDLKCTLVQTRF